MRGIAALWQISRCVALGLMLQSGAALAREWQGTAWQTPDDWSQERRSSHAVGPLRVSSVPTSDGNHATTPQAANQPTSTTPAPATGRAFDPSVVASGQAAFDRSCISCHDAERSLGKSKNYAGWLGTVQRMTAKDGADIPSSEVVPIATYLASLSSSSASAAGSSAEDAGGWTFGTTVSTLHRSASDEAPLENPGFFADVWVTASYQSSGPWRASVTACTSCHTSVSYNLELVEGSATLDLRHWYCGSRTDDGREMLLKAGRFVVPFGGFSAMSHPGVYRTVTNPLMVNMGRRAFVPGSSPNDPVLPKPVLPMPFSDEGVNFIFRDKLAENLNFSLDLFAINGLQRADDFIRSRAYIDNNESPSIGARTTLGGDFFRLGASALGGNLQDQGLPAVDYRMAGADATAQISQRLRFYFEYAMRRQDSVIVPGTAENTYGIVTELEQQLFDQPNVSLLVRYDTLEHRNQEIGNRFGDASLQRLTWGFNIGLPGGSLLMINHEHWVPGIGDDLDLLGVRWSVSL